MLYNQHYTIKELIKIKENAQRISYLVLTKNTFKKKYKHLKNYKAYIAPSHGMTLLCAKVIQSKGKVNGIFL